MTVEPLCLGFSPDEFANYVKKLGRMEWAPQAVTLHNTFFPNLAKVDAYLAKKQWSESQLIQNWWTQYRQRKWFGGPHLFIFRDKIWVANPLTMHGTHSPSFNKDHFGVEMIGDYDIEILPDSLRHNAVHAMACLLNKIGKHATEKTVHFHGEDPATTHKHCPGKNVGPKAGWIAAIDAAQKQLIF